MTKVKIFGTLILIFIAALVVTRINGSNTDVGQDRRSTLPTRSSPTVPPSDFDDIVTVFVRFASSKPGIVTQYLNGKPVGRPQEMVNDTKFLFRVPVGSVYTVKLEHPTAYLLRCEIVGAFGDVAEHTPPDIQELACIYPPGK